MKSLHTYAFALAAVLTCAAPAAAFQKGKRDDPPPPAPSPTRTTPLPRRPPKKKERVVVSDESARVKSEARPKPNAAPKLAELVISTNPPDSQIFINGVEYTAQGGAVRQSQLKPDTYKVVVRREGYREEEYKVSLVAGEKLPLDVRLERAFGTLNVTPNVDGAEIIVHDAVNNRRVGRYDERVANLHVPPGRYEVAVSKSGYRTATREVTVTSAQTLYLEPPLEQLPPEKPRIRADVATTIRASVDGKFLLVELTGKSGDASATAGALEVAVSMGGDTRFVSGMLPGYPCRVDFVRLENVSEHAFGEAPGPGNQWGRLAVRVRPKDSKRAMRFLINWVLLDDASAVYAPGAGSPARAEVAPAAQPFTPAVALKKVTPSYPPSARNARTEGMVSVTVEIDEQGNVVSARATDGPNALKDAAEEAARQWKFSPAREGGRAVRSKLSVQFAFRF